MNKKNILKNLLIAMLISISLTGCNDNNSSNNTTTSNSVPGVDPTGVIPDLSYVGELDFYGYIQGNDTLKILKDIGSDAYGKKDFTEGTFARIAGAAREFKKYYPAIKINFNYIDFQSLNIEIQKYTNNKGHLPHIMHSPDTVAVQVKNGLVTDLSQYQNWAYYEAINPSYFNHFNFNGFVGAVPFLVYPMGLFVNTGIVESQMLSIDYDNWTMEQYTNLIKNSHKPGVHAGIGKVSEDTISIADEHIYASFIENNYIDLNQTNIKDMIDMENEWSKYSAFEQPGNTQARPGFDVYNYRINQDFIDLDRYTINASNPFAINFYSQYASKLKKEASFDYLPIPKSNEDDEHRLGLIVEGLTIGNNCSDLTPCNSEEKAATDAAAAFAFFMATDTRAYESISKVEYIQGGETLVGVPELPIVKPGYKYSYNYTSTSEYDLQWKIYEKQCPTFIGKPGFTMILDIINNYPERVYNYNAIYAQVSDAIGTEKHALDEWRNRYTNTLSPLGSSNYVSVVVSQLNNWTEISNARLENTATAFRESIIEQYGEKYRT